MPGALHQPRPFSAGSSRRAGCRTRPRTDGDAGALLPAREPLRSRTPPLARPAAATEQNHRDALTMTLLAPTQLFTGDEILEGAIVRIRDGLIVDITGSPAPDALQLDGLLAPGFIDVQVNGGGGVLFNEAPTAETLATIAAAHRKFGVTGFMATLISDDRDTTARALDAVAGAVRAGVEGVIGLHLEGPWLSDARRGVHPAEKLRAFDAEDLALLTRPRAFPLMVTVAPETVEPGTIKALADSGIVVSLGHTAAAAEDVEAALAAGARGFTHLFNAMPAMEGRNPGPVGVALAHRESWAGLILDGIHVHPLTARAALQA